MSLSNRWRRISRETQEPGLPVSAMDRRVSRSLLRRPQLLALGCAALFTAVACYGYVRYGLQRTLSVAADRVVISTVRVGSFHDYIPLTGNVQPGQTVYLDAIDGGQVAELLVEEGAFVQAHQPLVRLNNPQLQLQVIGSEAQLSEQLNRLASTKLAFEQSRLRNARELIDAQFQAEQAAQRLARMQALVETGAVRRSELEDAQLELKRLRDLLAALQEAKHSDERLQQEQIAQVNLTLLQLNRNLKIARQNLDNLTVRAPIAGQLTSLQAHPGESKRPGERIGQIDQMDAYKVEALVDEHYLPRAAVGQEATADIGGVEHRLQLIKMYPEVRERQFKVDLAFVGEAPASVRRGQSFQLRLALGAVAQGLLVANGPFYDDAMDVDGQSVFVVAGGQAQRRAVKLGRRNPESVEVLAGLAADDRIITSSYETLKNYSRIELRGNLQ
jgi:HlyD family secretion protein